MTKQVYKLFTVLILIIFGCKNDEKQTSQNKNILPVNNFEEKEQDSLRIEGDNIWVRNMPKKGEVVMKLNQGDLCVILDTSKVDTIRGNIDYWYKIKHKDTIGWVFGSQTNIKTESSKETELFLEQMKTFVTALEVKDFKKLNNFIFPKEPVHCLLGSLYSNYFRTTITYDLKKTSEEYYDIKDLLDQFPNSDTIAHKILYTTKIKEQERINMHMKYGIYYQRLQNGNNYISNYEDWQLKNSMTGDSLREYIANEHPIYTQREKEVKFILIIALVDIDDEEYNYPSLETPFQFYFYLREGKWYLSGIYHPYVN